MATDAQIKHLLEKLRKATDSEAANTLMELFPSLQPQQTDATEISKRLNAEKDGILDGAIEKIDVSDATGSSEDYPRYDITISVYTGKMALAASELQKIKRTIRELFGVEGFLTTKKNVTLSGKVTLKCTGTPPPSAAKQPAAPAPVNQHTNPEPKTPTETK